MKKNKIRSVLITTAIMFAFSGCGKKKDKDEEPTTEAAIAIEANESMGPAGDIELVSKEGCVINELTGEWIDESLENQRPLTIMINNISDAMPQSGISDADIIFEMIVEGGITRLMAVFKDYENLPKLGSVRSCRQYYVQVSMMLNAIYAHIGQSWLGQEWLDKTGIDNLNGLGGIPSEVTFYRDNSKYAPHNCYTDGPKLIAGIEGLGYSREYTDRKDNMFKFYYEDTNLGTNLVANKVTLKFSSGYSPRFEYNADEGVYYRFQYGGPHMDEYYNKQLSFKNVLIIFAGYSTYEDGLRDIDWNKGGAGYYATNGEYKAITWKLDNDVIKCYDENGTQLKMNPGKTFVTVFEDTIPDNIIFE